HHASKQPLFGLWMIEELSHHGYKVGASQLYPKIHRLEQKGHLRRQDKVVDGKLRKYYRATPGGKRHLRQQKRKLMELAGEALSVDEIRKLLEMRLARESQKRRG
ncbi:MAG: PadR family transcriptional regulator, partial [bacterium]|nr:PadR family transcriptional regulator [bacterium]